MPAIYVACLGMKKEELPTKDGAPDVFTILSRPEIPNTLSDASTDESLPEKPLVDTRGK